MFCGGKLCRFITVVRLSKNSVTVVRLNAVARAKLVAWGFLIDRVGLRLMKAENQSAPAMLVSFHFSGNDNP